MGDQVAVLLFFASNLQKSRFVALLRFAPIRLDLELRMFISKRAIDSRPRQGITYITLFRSGGSGDAEFFMKKFWQRV